MDIAIPHVRGHWQSLDLKYTLRSIDKFHPEHGYVILIGHTPDWFKGSGTEVWDGLKRGFGLDWGNRESYMDKPFLDTMQKLFDFAGGYHGEEFLFWDDDMILLEPYCPQVYHRADTKTWGPGQYKRAWERTCEELTLRGIEHIRDFELHCPMLYQKSRVLELRTDEPVMFRSLYGNLNCPDSISINDNKLDTWGAEPIGKFVSLGDLFLGTPPAREWAERVFPQKSRWEL